MKTKLIILIAFLSSYNYSISQNDLQFGIKTGLNLSILNRVVELETRRSVHIGFLSEFPISKFFSIQPELMYSSQGTSFSEDALKLNYFILPIMAKYYFVDQISFEAGPQFGYLLSAKSEFSEQDNSDVTYQYRDLDFGVSLGFGYKLNSGINFSLRYYFGLASIYYYTDFGYDWKISNRVFQVSIGYFFKSNSKN